MSFLPITKQEMLDRGRSSCDFVYVIGDAYVDHPSFGHAIISRILEAHGYSVGIISQPDWKNPTSIDIFGKPRLGFLVSGGNIIPSPSTAGRPTLSPPAVKWASGQTTPPSFTAI